ncbi:PREDICTED: BTB/POZ domain-containing protein At5g03250-like isoform X1 [Populus euphratica]|uniref:BTB/POZ domain-containing protein At5g03250-like isoform X1 n=1 Tax=Populus euphratica TaxID=75702 RepID=A0AAJ6X6Z2_POPEU|nr:PREDICTED: BTB/POZ domain-containing protein At5g03250-like isoform X1 [Populus euphratica]
MASMKLGSKTDGFHRDGKTWYCTTGLPSDVTIEVGEMTFNLHKFPLLSRSGLLEKLIEELSIEVGSVSVLKLNDMPAGAKAFELIARFCYGIKIEMTSLNVVSLRCAAEYLRMTEDYGEGNLIVQAEAFLDEVFGSWTDSIKALETCEEVLPYAEEIHIVPRCIDSLAMKACADPNVFNLPVAGQTGAQSQRDVILWNGISSSANKPQPINEDWWFQDVSFLNLPLYKRLILAVESRGMKPETISASLIYYAKRYLPLMSRQSSFDHASNGNPWATVSIPSETDQRVLLEEIVTLLPKKKGVTSPEFLIMLLRTAMVLHASPSCRENLEKKAGAQLDQAVLVDLLIPNMGYSVETLYDIDCAQRMLDHFMSLNQNAALSTPPCIVEEGQFLGGPDTLQPLTMVASLVDGFLAEVAPDVNLKPSKFEALAATIPDYARPLDDGVYHAVDVYLKAHPWLTDTEKEQLCRLMNCQKLSLEACTHAAQNERLPLRVIVQVLFFEQLRLRTSISGWFYVSENLDNSQNPCGSLELPKNDGSHQINSKGRTVGVDDVKERVSELERECLTMKQDLQKILKTKRSWKIFSKTFGFRRKLQPCNSKESCELKEPEASANGLQNHENSGFPK